MLHSLTIPAYRNALTALSGQLARALGWGEDNGVGERQLLAARLAPDMLPLPTQIRFSCGQALQAVTRLGAHGAPDFAEDAMDFAGMQDQIARTLAWLEALDPAALGGDGRSEEHTSELQSLMRISYAVFCLKKKKNK